MKFLTFSDIHENKKAIAELAKRAREKDIDFCVCAGDFSTFGKGVEFVFKTFQETGKKLYIIPGNHEEREGLLEKVVPVFSNVVLFHRQAVEIDGYVFMGYGGGGFAQEDAVFRKIASQWYGNFKGKKIVLVTHGPPFATTLDRLEKRHVGSKDYRKFIERIKPKVAISGHLHETVGMTDTIGSTKLVNPGWEGMVIELK